MAGALPKFGLGTGTFTLPPLKKSTLGGVVTIKMPALPVRKSKATQEQWSCNYHCVTIIVVIIVRIFFILSFLFY